ncbi:MAG TPA: hypothetical protein VGB45_02690 [Abditibacterium sp.]|jgi:hypothetical protein
MPAPSLSPPNPTVTVTFTPSEVAQLEAFASLHGVSLVAFVQRAALDAAHIKQPKREAQDANALWLSDELTSVAEPAKADPFEVLADSDAEESKTSNDTSSASTPLTKRGVTGEPSKFARGQGPVWDIRQALGHERVHGLGWTREQLAFVLKLSVVGVRKMEHLGTAPIKSLEARKNLLNLAKTLENPTPQIVAFIESEDATLERL